MSEFHHLGCGCGCNDRLQLHQVHAVQMSAQIVRINGPETAFVAEVMNVIERHSQELTVHQICGGLFAAAHEVLTGEHEDI
jgi:hypothetical protein